VQFVKLFWKEDGNKIEFLSAFSSASVAWAVLTAFSAQDETFVI
jgi:hypothetical protein